jgi:hypothetical protein
VGALAHGEHVVGCRLSEDRPRPPPQTDGGLIA